MEVWSSPDPFLQILITILLPVCLFLPLNNKKMLTNINFFVAILPPFLPSEMESRVHLLLSHGAIAFLSHCHPFASGFASGSFCRISCGSKSILPGAVHIFFYIQFSSNFHTFSFDILLHLLCCFLLVEIGLWP